MPRATPFELYAWRRRNMPELFAVDRVKPPNKFRVNPFVQALLVGDQYPHLARFCNSVDTRHICSPALVVALMICARLFGTPWRTDETAAPAAAATPEQAVTTTTTTTTTTREWRGLLAPQLVDDRTAHDVDRFNSANSAVGALELLEMTELVREFLRAPLETVSATARRHADLIDSATLEVFGRSSAAENDAYRIGLLLVMVNSSPSVGVAGWYDLVRHLRWSGVVQLSWLGRLNKLFASSRLVSDDELRAILRQFGVSKARFASLSRGSPNKKE
jgi:hypothetical protein